MPRQLEYAQYAKYAKQSEHAHVVGLVKKYFKLVVGEYERNVVGQDRDEVDEVERVLEELDAVRRRKQPQQKLDREPADAKRLDHFEYRILRVISATARQLVLLVNAFDYFDIELFDCA